MQIENKITSLNTPFIHLLFINELNNLKDLRIEDNIELIPINGSKCGDINGLFSEFSKKMNFPDYFGDNWNSFDECINDLSWLKSKQYLILINDTEKLLANDNENFEVLIEILSDTCMEWAEGREYGELITFPTPFHVIFCCTDNKEKHIIERFKSIGIVEFDIIK
ncbi:MULTISPECIES: barstar family protein [Bacillus cereus group]|uniref:barstar family protein n=1 Tax=Bacillus cereus group TaxID=86661 RepID=UPI0009773E4A|nr:MULTISPECIES: barstar family protein [Bacillus cereus group]ONG69982.1 ribonuclease inhibitor [Bacillus cereus]MCD1178904.1 barstar family protein [Bacillus paranthracis]ONG86529.1 ribonuclease inhibitor [Bacillus cereus]USK98060.1 barstar family protein [Bacillus tropicus]HDR4565347.1 barstar family protein [Bacillus paranthracis]